MIKTKGILSLALVSVLSATLAGCGNAVSDVQPLTLEEVAGSRLAQMSTDQKEGLIYKYVSDRITVDKARLLNIQDEDTAQINQLLVGVDSKLQGKQMDKFSDDYANYMLMEFARTPFEWKRSGVESVGFDPAARLYFVDVTYKTTNKLKKVVPDSKIPRGSEDEEVYKKKRYEDYVSYLMANAAGDSSANARLLAFKQSWGDVQGIMDEQQGTSLLDRTRKIPGTDGTVGKLTYSGLVSDSRFVDGAQMTFRFVLKYNFNLGTETDMSVQSVYLKDYLMNNSSQFDTATSNTYSADDTGLEVLRPFLDKTILGYHKSVDESNSTGLSSLFVNYGGVDKYYEDMNKYMYTTIEGYTFDILQRRGTDVLVKVDRVNKFRAKGSNMSMPTYDEQLVYDLELSNDDKIRVKSVNLIKSTLVGEPLSVIKNVSGISDLIQYSGESFTDANRSAIEESIKKFSKVVFDGKGGTSDFTQIVDVGVPEATMKKISDYIEAIPDAKHKLTYVVSWNTKTNVYVSLTLREVFETPNGNYDTESVIDLANRDGDWKVTNYTRTMNVKISALTGDSKNALTEETR